MHQQIARGIRRVINATGVSCIQPGRALVAGGARRFGKLQVIVRLNTTDTGARETQRPRGRVVDSPD
jgi:hypothetical protein